MLLSKMFLPTLREFPSDAEVISHKLMTKAGMIRKVAAGVYSILPLGVRVMKRVEEIVRREMDLSGAQEVSMPTVIPGELWKETDRWDFYGKELTRFKDRHDRDFCLGPTHEEVITDMVRDDVKSYKNLPLNLYQIQTKFRDEIRPRFGLMRGREFIMKDAYSFHETQESLDQEYKNMYDTYTRIFTSCGLHFKAVEADTGQIGGSSSHEFMVLAETGEDDIATCTKCDYAANIEKAEIAFPVDCYPHHEESFKTITEVETIDKKTIEEVSEFLSIEKEKFIKTIVFSTDKGLKIVLVRGDHEVNEVKVKNFFNVNEIELAGDEEIEKDLDSISGYIGPVGLYCKGSKADIVADFSIREIFEGVTGSNKKDFHLMSVLPGRDFTTKYADLRLVTESDPCPKCKGKIEIKKGIEVGHIFKLGTKYSESMNATFLNKDGKAKPFIMGCYGMGIGRTAAAAIEQNNDDNGMIWPKEISPFDLHFVVINEKDSDVMAKAMEIYNDLQAQGFSVLMDERNERPGVKFKDADLIGVPMRATISKKTLAEDSLEIKGRRESEAKLVKISDFKI